MKLLGAAALAAGCVVAGMSLAGFVVLYGGVVGEAMDLVLDIVFGIAQVTARACTLIAGI